MAKFLTHSEKLFLRVAVNLLTATIQIFYLGLGLQGVLARLHSAARCAPPCLSADRNVFKD